MRGWRGVAIGASGILVFWGAVAAVLVFAVGGSGSERNEVVVSEAGCGLGWRAPRSGSVTFTVKNTSAATAFNVQLLSDDQKLLYAKTNVVGPSTEVAMPVVLPPGSYLFCCQGSNGLTETSAGGRTSCWSPGCGTSRIRARSRTSCSSVSRWPMRPRARCRRTRVACVAASTSRWA